MVLLYTLMRLLSPQLQYRNLPELAPGERSRSSRSPLLRTSRQQRGPMERYSAGRWYFVPPGMWCRSAIFPVALIHHPRRIPSRRSLVLCQAASPTAPGAYATEGERSEPVVMRRGRRYNVHQRTQAPLDEGPPCAIADARLASSSATATRRAQRCHLFWARFRGLGTRGSWLDRRRALHLRRARARCWPFRRDMGGVGGPRYFNLPRSSCRLHDGIHPA